MELRITQDIDNQTKCTITGMMIYQNNLDIMIITGIINQTKTIHGGSTTMITTKYNNTRLTDIMVTKDGKTTTIINTEMTT